jgi:hypothetical protein
VEKNQVRRWNQDCYCRISSTTKVKNGVVPLTGDVNSFWDKAHAYDVVSRIAGVRGVINNIKVNSDLDQQLHEETHHERSLHKDAHRKEILKRFYKTILFIMETIKLKKSRRKTKYA